MREDVEVGRGSGMEERSLEIGEVCVEMMETGSRFTHILGMVTRSPDPQTKKSETRPDP